MKNQIIYLFFALSFLSCKNEKLDNQVKSLKQQTCLKLGYKNNKIAPIWIDALKTRQKKEYLDSIKQITRPLSKEENNWVKLIESRLNYWSSIKDSIKVPFSDVFINDTTFVLLGYTGYDDGFSYKDKTVCFDVTALNREYGSALDSINTNRMDRLFAHEYTHLLSKSWAKKNHLKLSTYQDDILWECIYEGFGMYRSMSRKWFPVDGNLSDVSFKTFETLYPIFVERLITIDTLKNPSESDKIKYHKNLSRGSMKQKWGALPIGVWLAMESKGDDSKLNEWVNKGPDAVILLAQKYLTGESKITFEKHFNLKKEKTNY